MSAQEKIIVYGANWCGVTRMTMRHLDEVGVQYSYIDIDQDREAAAWVRDQNNGKELKPTLSIEGEVLSAPKNYMLDDSLKRHGLVS